MQYIPPFETIKAMLNLTSIRGKLVATASYDDILALARTMLSGVTVDEAWYLKQYPDVAQAITEGTFKSAKEHFLGNGYFEGRLPFQMIVDETWYLQQYPELAEALRNGAIESAQQHFDAHGYKEGRKPRPL